MGKLNEQHDSSLKKAELWLRDAGDGNGEVYQYYSIEGF